MKLSLQEITAPSIEPVTAATAKTHLRVDVSDDDTLIGALITAARQIAEHYTNRRFIQQTWTLWLDRFPYANIEEPWWDGVVQGHINMISAASDVIEIPYPPLSSVTHLKTYDTDNDASTFSSDYYVVDTSSSPGRIILNQGQTWPTDLRSAKAIEIQFVCGYGTATTDVPQAIIQAILVTVAHLYEHRGDETKFDLPIVAKKLLDPYKVRRLQ